MKKILASRMAGLRYAVPALSLCAVILSATPAFAEKPVCDVRSYGAKGDGKTKDTKAIQTAIDDCNKKGGGTVKLAGATFVSAPIVLKSNIVLDIEVGATLFGSPDHDDYPDKTEFRDRGKQSLVSATNAENIVIHGGGTIDGNGESWWINRDQVRAPGAADGDHPRPRLVVFDHCKNVTMENVTVQNSPMWQIVPYYSENLVFRNLKVLAPAHSHNTDAIDPFSSKHIVIDHVYADTGDDNIAIKSGQPNSPGEDEPSSDITITDCTFLRGHGLSIGSEIAGGVKNVVAERITFKGTDNGIRVKSNRDRGNDIGNFTFRDITMEDVKTAILISEYYPKIPQGDDPAQPITRLTPHFHDILIENVKATGSNVAGIIVGLPESPVKNVVLKNVSIGAKKGMTISYADVQADHLTVKPESGEPLLVGKGVTGNLK